MKVLVTGHDGYIGSVLVPMLQAEGHEVTGIDTFFFADAHHLIRMGSDRDIRQDIRTLALEEFDGCEAVVHLAGLSNDPLSEINPELTHAINHRASVSLARLAKEAGVRRFLFSSTCSVYGAVNQAHIADEVTPLLPLTAYAISKMRVEEDLSRLADESFSPVFLRNATAYGWSPNFRSDLVLNNLTGWAHTSGEIRILSDGSPWRPLAHVEDISQAFLAALAAPRHIIHNQAFNVGRNEENYQVRDLAAIAQESYPACKVIINETANPDQRSYRVNFSKIAGKLRGFKPKWDARKGVEQLHQTYTEHGLAYDDFTGPRYVRIRKLKALMVAGMLDEHLYWKEQVVYPSR